MHCNKQTSTHALLLALLCSVLSGQVLSGTLPATLNFTALQVLDLSNNKLRGSLPATLGLPTLQVVLPPRAGAAAIPRWPCQHCDRMHLPLLVRLASPNLSCQLLGCHQLLLVLAQGVAHCLAPLPLLLLLCPPPVLPCSGCRGMRTS